ncbi:MAG: flagellar basal body P-ring formation chaperone FlgA [Methylococcales bacterium]
MINHILISLVLALAATTSHAQDDMQSHESINAAVTEFISSTINLSGEFEVELIPIDVQLQLPICSIPLEVFIPIDSIKAGRNAIGVRCNGEKKWSIFTTALVKVFQQVFVLAQPIQRGEILTRQHLSLEKRDVSKLHDDFVTQSEQIENKQASRQLAAGTILNTRQFVEPKLIKRGDKVVISANRDTFVIKMDGTAMMDGVKGQRISIKNESSKRIVNATVIEPGLVSVN